MSTKAALDDLLAEFDECVEKVERTTKNIASESTRIAYELKKSQVLVNEHKLPLKQFGRVIEVTQSIVDVCSNFQPPIETNESSIGHSSSGDRAGAFTHFVDVVKERSDQCEKEIAKLNSFTDVLHSVSHQ